FTNRVVFMGGDFNIDVSDTNRAGAQVLRELVDHFKLQDGFSNSGPTSKYYTWSNGKDRFRRLDYIFTTLRGLSQAEQVIPVWFSNHMMLSVSMTSVNSGPRSSFWRLNTKVLSEADYRSRITVLLENFLNKRWRFSSAVGWWEACKRAVSKESIKYCCHRKDRERREVERLQSELQSLYEAFNRGRSFDAVKAAELRMKEVWQAKSRDFLFRVKGDLQEKNEKCSALFFGSVRSKQARTLIKCLRQKDGSVITDPSDMVMCASEFYRELFTEKSVDTALWDELLSGVEGKTENMDELDGALSGEELKAAMAGLRKGTAPGIDGLPIDFYSVFWVHLQPMLLAVFMFKESIEKGVLPTSMTQGLITIIPKPDKDHLLIDNWRPITLINNDGKILASIFAERLKTGLDSIIDESQSGFMKGRHICNNIRLVLDLVDYGELISQDSFIL
uniref:Uncharacterized protein n=1 Tax=Lepisosteus oculatus TaxID=7918 RepID=W5LWZ9_LEPOC